MMDNTILYAVGEIREGTITGIQPYGAFVLFPNGQQGLIHISEISSRFVRSINDYVQVGKTVRVKIIGEDTQNHYLRLSLKQTLERERQIIRKPPVLKRKRKNDDETKDFQALADHLDEWIEEAWKKEEKTK